MNLTSEAREIITLSLRYFLVQGINGWIDIRKRYCMQKHTYMYSHMNKVIAILKVSAKITMGLLCFFFLACDNGSNVDNELITERSYCLDNYERILLTISPLVTQEFYKERQLENFESLRLDTNEMASTLYVKYKFKYNVDDFKMGINSMIIFQKNEEETIRTYNTYTSIFESGINSPETRQKQATKTIDDILSFGEESKAYEYWRKDYIIGCFLMGRTKNLIVLYSVLGDHVVHHDFKKILKRKIEQINQITAPNLRAK